MPVPLPSPLPAALRVVPWPDPVIDELGFDLRSHYVERFWLGVLGPSTTFLLRRVAVGFDTDPDGFDLDLALTAGALGLASRGGRNSPFARALVRSTTFGLSRLDGERYEVRRRVPPLNLAQLARLPEAVRAEHDAWQSTLLDRRSVADHQQRARHLARELLAAGEPVDTVEGHLHRARFHPAVAYEALRWARTQSIPSDPASADDRDVA